MMTDGDKALAFIAIAVGCSVLYDLGRLVAYVFARRGRR